jgi:FkbM family methyltransferase
MKRSDRIRLNFIRNWTLPGKERLARMLKLSADATTRLKDGIIWLKDENIALYSSADSYIESTILKNGSYESEIAKLIAIFLKEGDVALDIGANIGLQSLRMAAAVGAYGKVYAFEPLHYLQQKLKSNLLLNRADNVLLMPVALSDTESEQEYPVNPNSWNQGTFSLRDSVIEGHVQTIQINIGDELAEIAQLHQLNFIKIDVEGFEFRVISGLKTTIVRHRPVIVFEYDENYWKQSGNDIDKCYNFFIDHNYQLYQINEANAELIASAKAVEGGNVLCIPK